MTYELWESRGGNLIGTFSSKAEALAVVRQQTEAAGLESVLSWFLGAEKETGESALIAEGAGLEKLARGAASTA